MCTALQYSFADRYFGRTLDLDRSYGEEVCVLPRNFPLSFRCLPRQESHFALIGMATVVENTPLFYDAVNEYGLAMAGLNFPGNAYYSEPCSAKDNVAPFEFIPWVLGQCKTLEEGKKLLSELNLVNIPFAESLPNSPLHWMISDGASSVVVEAMADGLHIYQNPVGVMTNNPPFEVHLANLKNYRNLRVDNGENTFSSRIPLNSYCQGLGALGLPGDVSSMSRFVRAAFWSQNSLCGKTEEETVSEFFRLLSTVEMPKGGCKTEAGTWDITLYTSCMNLSRGIYYYTTYYNRQIRGVDLRKTNWEGETLTRFPLVQTPQIAFEN